MTSPLSSQTTKQMMVVEQEVPNPTQALMRVALWGADGNPLVLTPQTGAQILLTGYEIGVADDIEPTDTLNEALAKLEQRVVALEEA